jgi:hypothetical protein
LEKIEVLVPRVVKMRESKLQVGIQIITTILGSRLAISVKLEMLLSLLPTPQDHHLLDSCPYITTPLSID